MEETKLTKAQKMIENMMISLAIQEFINQKALMPTPEMKAQMDAMIIELAESIKSAEA
jgi:BarA-like signal transduction histidine kinase